MSSDATRGLVSIGIAVRTGTYNTLLRDCQLYGFHPDQAMAIAVARFMASDGFRDSGVLLPEMKRLAGDESQLVDVPFPDMDAFCDWRNRFCSGTLSELSAMQVAIDQWISLPRVEKDLALHYIRVGMWPRTQRPILR